MTYPTTCPHCHTNQHTGQRLDIHLKFRCPVIRPEYTGDAIRPPTVDTDGGDATIRGRRPPKDKRRQQHLT